MPKPLDPVVKMSRENERLKIDNANLRSINRKVLRRGGGFDDLVEQMKRVAEDDVNFTFPTKLLPSISPQEPNHEEIACAAVSDLHLSEVVRPEDCNGVNSYNCIIAANRLWTHSQKIKSILGRHLHLYPIKKIWSMVLGDMISGSIHQELMLTNQLSDPAAVILASRLLWMFYTELKGIGLPIEIDTICGNHPRTSLKMPTKAQAVTNFDWIVYSYLADRFEKDDQVSIDVHTSQIAVKQLYGWRFLIEHGLDVQNGKEEIFEDKLRNLFDDPTYRKQSGTGASFDQVVIAHLHKLKYLERTIVNGSYVGQAELGMSWRLRPVRASQALWGVSKKQVRTWAYNLDFTDVQSTKAENPMSEYAVWYVKRYGSKT